MREHTHTRSQYLASVLELIERSLCIRCILIAPPPFCGLKGWGVGGGGGWRRVAANIDVHTMPRMLTYLQNPSLVLPVHMATMHKHIQYITGDLASQLINTSPPPHCIITPAYQHPSTSSPLTLHHHTCISTPHQQLYHILAGYT